MANQLQDLNMITKEAVTLFKNSNMFLQNINSQYDGLFIGNTLRVKLPNVATAAKVISAKEVIVLGAAAMIARNPVISRRWWGK